MVTSNVEEATVVALSRATATNGLYACNPYGSREPWGEAVEIQRHRFQKVQQKMFYLTTFGLARLLREDPIRNRVQISQGVGLLL